MKLIFIGPPGSGKGTVAKKLITAFGLTHISPGEMLREEVIKKTSLGKEIDKYISKGHLVPDQMASDMVKLKIRSHPNFVLDGFPRTLEQAKILEDFVKVDLVIFIDVSKKISVERISGRRVCSKCETPYHTKYVAPKKNGICDKCGGKLIQRSDEKPAVVKERFKVYQRKSLPLINFYKKTGILKKVDGSGTPEEVYGKVKGLVEIIK
jgi:adenylate kinase